MKLISNVTITLTIIIVLSSVVFSSPIVERGDKDFGGDEFTDEPRNPFKVTRCKGYLCKIPDFMKDSQNRSFNNDYDDTLPERRRRNILHNEERNDRERTKM